MSLSFEEVKQRIIELIRERGDEITRQFLGSPEASSWQSSQGLPNILEGLIIEISEELNRLQEYDTTLKNKINEIIRAWNNQGFTRIDELP